MKVLYYTLKLIILAIILVILACIPPFEIHLRDMLAIPIGGFSRMTF